MCCRLVVILSTEVKLHGHIRDTSHNHDSHTHLDRYYHQYLPSSLKASHEHFRKAYGIYGWPSQNFWPIADSTSLYHCAHGELSAFALSAQTRICCPKSCSTITILPTPLMIFFVIQPVMIQSPIVQTMLLLIALSTGATLSSTNGRR